MPNGCSPQQYLSPPPSPLGPSKYYDALDEDDDPFEEDDDAEYSDNTASVYSNFNHIGGIGLDVEDYDTHSPFSGEEENCQPWIPSTSDGSPDLNGGIEQGFKSLSTPCPS